MSEFDSGLEVGEPVVVLPEELLRVFKAIQRRLPGLEWLAYLRGRWEGPRFVLAGDYYIPRQEVTSSTVEVDEEDAAAARGAGYNAVVHSHHSLSLHSFSSTDDVYLADFDASLLYADGKIVHAVVRLRTPAGTWVWVPAKAVVAREEPPVEPEGLERIRRKIYGYLRLLEPLY